MRSEREATPRIEEGSESDDPSDDEDVTIATLPHNYKFGPVFNIAIRMKHEAWQLMVEVPSICNDLYEDSCIKVYVVISHGITQWARWQGNTGDPYDGGFNPIPPEGDDSFARGDPGMEKIHQDIPELNQIRKDSKRGRPHATAEDCSRTTRDTGTICQQQKKTK